MDNHHPAGENNSPITVPIPVNDHRADLTESQRDWGRHVLENPDRDPVLMLVAWLRGAGETIAYLVRSFIHKAADVLECLAAYLRQQLGSQWWRGTPIERYAPKP